MSDPRGPAVALTLPTGSGSTAEDDNALAANDPAVVIPVTEDRLAARGPDRPPAAVAAAFVSDFVFPRYSVGTIATRTIDGRAPRPEAVVPVSPAEIMVTTACVITAGAVLWVLQSVAWTAWAVATAAPAWAYVDPLPILAERERRRAGDSIEKLAEQSIAA